MRRFASFRDAFVAHLERTGATVADIARKRGLSKGQLDKLRQGRTQKTNVDDAVEIAAYFGKSVDEFIGKEPDAPTARIAELAALLSDEERAFLLHQLEFAASRKNKKS